MRLLLTSSPRLTGLFIIIHLGALSCLIFSAAPWLLKITGAMVCFYSAWHTIRKYAQLSDPKAIVQCVALENNVWLLTDRQGREQTVSLLGDSWRSRYLLILNFKRVQQPKRLSVILAGDMLEQNVLRRLRVYLTLRNA